MKKKLLWILGALSIVIVGVGIGSVLTKSTSAAPPATPTPEISNPDIPSDSATPVPTDVPDPTLEVSISTPAPTIAPTLAPTAVPVNAPDKNHSSLIPDNLNPTAGSQATLTVTLRNSSGLALPGLTVNLSTSDNGAVFTNNGATTDNAGQVKILVSSPNSSTDSINVAVSGNNISTNLDGLGSVSFQAAPLTSTPIPSDTPSPSPSATPTP